MRLDYQSMTLEELHRLESDIKQPSEVWREALAEINRRQTVLATATPKQKAVPVPAAGVALTRVTIDGIDVPFWELVVTLVKLSLASIPALIILAVIAGFVVAVFRAIGAIALR
jgi:hypothetical protein